LYAFYPFGFKFPSVRNQIAGNARFCPDLLEPVGIRAVLGAQDLAPTTRITSTSRSSSRTATCRFCVDLGDQRPRRIPPAKGSFLRYGREFVTGCDPLWSMPTGNLFRPC
jgi:hypothetical protein